MDFGRFITGLLFSADPGRRGERIAARYLRRQGYRILARNVHLSSGEIDLIAEATDKRTIVIVEVKAATVTVTCEAETTASNSPSNSPAARILPEAHVNHEKRRKLIRLAWQAVKRYRWQGRPVRFDVVGVDLPPRGKPIIRHHIAAFESHV